MVDLVHPQIACGRPDGKAAFRCTRHQKIKYRMTRITPGNPAQEFPYQHNEPTEHRTLPAVTQMAAEVLRVSAIPLAIASMVLIAFELVLIG